MPALTPRATAAAMIEAILAGQDPAPMLAAMLDPARQALARTQAAIALRRLQQHARIAAGTADLPGAPARAPAPAGRALPHPDQKDRPLIRITITRQTEALEVEVSATVNADPKGAAGASIIERAMVLLVEAGHRQVRA